MQQQVDQGSVIGWIPSYFIKQLKSMVLPTIVNKMDVLKEVQTWRVREGDKQFVYF